MTMALKPIQKGSLEFSWGGWKKLINYLDKWGVCTAEFKQSNDGDIICAVTCKVVADVLVMHQAEVPEIDQWLVRQAPEWRALADAGGCEQW